MYGYMCVHICIHEYIIWKGSYYTVLVIAFFLLFKNKSICIDILFI